MPFGLALFISGLNVQYEVSWIIMTKMMGEYIQSFWAKHFIS